MKLAGVFVALVATFGIIFTAAAEDPDPANPVLTHLISFTTIDVIDHSPSVAPRPS